MGITKFTDLWIIYFDSDSYKQYKALLRMGLKNRLKEYILSRYLTDYEIKYSLAGKPFVLTGENPNIFFSYSSNKKAAALAVSDTDVGVDVEHRERDLRELVTWAHPWMEAECLRTNNKKEEDSIFLSQLIWCRIESFIKLSNSTLFDFLCNKKNRNQFDLFQKVHFGTLVFKDFVCVVAKQESFSINHIFHIDFSNLIVQLQDGT